ncbi:gastric triacylglycerol lipase-like [Macrosteles quadrilineatus]|uniref:gastric triacylglycerol lipase-like n=1 Tax=Macrosteles quadrilineatus TaxID=74068 RepID=UPI0023E19FE4|nr:gastric triacylglycerol lipase-like [Macrosteles quadrilineatus]
MTSLVLVFTLILSTLLPSCSPGTYTDLGYKFSIDKIKEETGHLRTFVTNLKYPFEDHTITTRDGYVLTYHRVAASSPEVEGKRKEEAHRHPVLLVHGILQSSAFYLAIPQGLAYRLADAGFDVWVANHRGNPYSKAHLNLNPTLNSKYWEFSFDEMGKFDLPAAVDYILKKTNKKTLSYIGFSMGTTMFWTFAHYWPDYMSKIDCMIAMAPIAIPNSLSVVISKFNNGAVNSILRSLNMLNFYEFRPYYRRFAFIVRAPCGGPETKRSWLCRGIIKLVCLLSGMQEDLLSYKYMLSSLDFMSAGTSIQSLFHLLQVGSANEFMMYDYGERFNMFYYSGKTTPPKYDLTRVTVPVYLIQGGKDVYSVTKDTKILKERLDVNGKAYLFLEEEAKDYNHLDFFFADGANEIIHQSVVNKLSEHVK